MIDGCIPYNQTGSRVLRKLSKMAAQEMTVPGPRSGYLTDDLSIDGRIRRTVATKQRSDC